MSSLTGVLRREVGLQWDLEHLFGEFFSLALRQKQGRSLAVQDRLQLLQSYLAVFLEKLVEFVTAQVASDRYGGYVKARGF